MALKALLLILLHILLRTAEYAFSVRAASKTRTLLCAVLRVLASWTLSIKKTYYSATLVKGNINILSYLFVSFCYFYSKMFFLGNIKETLEKLQY